MLISFALENWASFRDRASLSMIASKERQHAGRIPRVPKYPVRILPVTAIYGGNASGKSTLFRALAFVRDLVIRGTLPDEPIRVEPFLLSADGVQRPTSFAFELLIDETIYEFSFSATHQAVVEEKLVRIRSDREETLYHRHDGKLDRKDDKNGQQDFLHFTFQGTRDNQLFLTNAVFQKVDDFKPVYNWFRNTLVLIAPEARYQPMERFLNDSDPLYTAMNEMLGRLDTGIAHLGTEELQSGGAAVLDVLEPVLNDLGEGMTVRLHVAGFGERFLATRREGQLAVSRMVACHARSDGKEVRFGMDMESDGSVRVIDLLPAFLPLGAGLDTGRVYVIDELDRSLHTLLTRSLLEYYLAACSPKSRTQLLFTTHDVLLMDQHLLRRDEMWVTERGLDGASSLSSFSDYDLRFDKDIRKSYLQGRLGGIPRILLSGALPPTAATNRTARHDSAQI